MAPRVAENTLFMTFHRLPRRQVRKDRSGDNPAVWKGNLFHLLPPRPKLQRGYMRALPYEDIPVFMLQLAATEGMAARALGFTILTIARESMTVEAT